MKYRGASIAGPAGSLDAAWHDPPRLAAPRFASVVAHPHPLYGGSKDNAVVLAATASLLAAGAAVLRFDFRGVGRSAGRHDGGPGELADLRAAAVSARAETAGLPLLVAGYSFGAVMALRLLGSGGGDAESRPVAVLAIAPPIGHYDFSFLSANTAPIAVVCGELDALTPAGELERQRRGWGAVRAVRWVAGVGHDLGALDRPDALRECLDSAISELLTAASLGNSEA